MTAVVNVTPEGLDSTVMEASLQAQRARFMTEPMPSLSQRREKLKALKRALLQYKTPLCEALSRDYGQRSIQDSLLADILPCVMNINYTLRHLKRWLKPSRRHAGLLLSPARVEVVYQPLGVVGIVVPWNFPVMLSIGPLITALAAGNRAMIKLSEFTPQTNKVLREMLAGIFEDDEVAVFEGEADMAAAFSALPFDHLLFTGSTAVGHRVMHAAADNLTPLTLELGGKSPVLVAPDMPLELAVERMVFGKSLNAGQICVAPDYVLVPDDKVDDFVSEYRKQFCKMYPQGVASRDFASIINERQYQRLTRLLDDARHKGARVIPCHDAARDDSRLRMITHLLLDTSEEMAIRQDEIFGPLLPVIPYREPGEALDFIRQRPRPLALYLMSFDPELQQRVITTTHAGGMAINDSVLHVGADDAPFGGIGPSGMGHYHGREGFETFSKAKTVFRRGKFTTAKLASPLYGRGSRRWLQKLIMAFFLR